MFKKYFKKNIWIYGLSFLFLSISLFLLNFVSADDLMEKAFKPAMSYDAVINLGSNKNAVGNEILRESMSVGMNENMGQGCFVNGQFVAATESQCTEMGGDRDIQAFQINSKPPLIVRITKFLLRMTIILSITMIIFNAVKYMIEILSGKDWKSAEAKNNLIRVAGGIVIALMSVGIINLIVSIPKSSLETDKDISENQELSCRVANNTISNNDTRQYICEEILNLGTILGNEAFLRDNDANKNKKCYVESKTKSECDSLGGDRGSQIGNNPNTCYINVENNQKIEKYICEDKIGYEWDNNRSVGSKCYLPDQTKQECEELGGKRGFMVGNNSNNCYIDISLFKYFCEEEMSGDAIY
ncbi:MAG TPA: hypothetical protein P5060_00355 [Candidatus Absconditabacterales bacterium]|nr:hypothetical protein [Candidatus Absconditabacterales bacterium]